MRARISAAALAHGRIARFELPGSAAANALTCYRRDSLDERQDIAAASMILPSAFFFVQDWIRMEAIRNAYGRMACYFATFDI